MFGEAEIQNFDAATRHDDHVQRFQVAMNHAMFVCVSHGIGDLLPITNHGFRGQACFRNLLRKQTALARTP